MTDATQALAETFGADAAATDALPEGAIQLDGQIYLRDAKGALVPIETVNAQDRLMDEVVRKIVGYAEPLRDQIQRFRTHTFGDVDSFVSLLEQHYQRKVGGTKGNLTLTSYDGLKKVIVQVADHISFGPELQVAKGLVDECLTDWSGDAGPELKAIVQRAFNVDQAGKINRAELLQLLRLEIGDERWVRAMGAIRDSIRVVGSKRYVRVYTRAKATDEWTAVSIDLAAA